MVVHWPLRAGGQNKSCASERERKLHESESIRTRAPLTAARPVAAGCDAARSEGRGSTSRPRGSSWPRAGGDGTCRVDLRAAHALFLSPRDLRQVSSGHEGRDDQALRRATLARDAVSLDARGARAPVRERYLTRKYDTGL